MTGSHVNQTITFYDGKHGELRIKLDDGADVGRMVVDRVAVDADKKLHSQPFARYLRTKAQPAASEPPLPGLVETMQKQIAELTKDLARMTAERDSLQEREKIELAHIKAHKARIAELEARVAELESAWAQRITGARLEVDGDVVPLKVEEKPPH